MRHLPDTMPGGKRPARALLVALALLISVCAWADNVTLVQVNWDPVNSWYRWEYVIEVTADPQGACGTEYTITGLYDVQAAGVANSVDWVANFTGTTASWQQVANCGLVDVPPTTYPLGPGAYFWYTARSNTQAVVNWDRLFGIPPPVVQSGTTNGSDAPLDYASVTVWDNHISFGYVDGKDGTYATPAPLVADGTPASAWGPTAAVPGANGYDIAGFRLETTRRLDLSIDCGGHLRRVEDDGTVHAGDDPRKTVAGPYELATQWKVKFFGMYLEPISFAQYSSPTSLQPTNYDFWTDWDQVGGDNPPHDTGWLWPSFTDAWSGNLLGGVYPRIPAIDLVIERNQYPGGTGEPAEMWVTERVLQRGLQDVQCNYRQNFQIHITVAE